MRFKYKKGDVLKYGESMFYIQNVGLKTGLYQVFVLDEFDIGTRQYVNFPSSSVQNFNRGFVERHCVLMKGATANAIKVLYGEREQ